MIRSLIITIAIYLAVSTGISYWVYQNAFQSRLEIERARGEVRLSEATSRLRGQLDVYRALANLVGRDSELETVLKLGSSTAIKNKLSQLSLTYGAGEINLADVHGRVVASSDTDSDKKRRPYSSSLINAALNGRLGSEQAIEENQRLFRFSMGVRESDGGGTIIGAIVVSVDLAALEFEWPVSPEPIIFLDADNRIFQPTGQSFCFSGLTKGLNKPDCLWNKSPELGTHPFGASERATYLKFRFCRIMSRI